MKHDASTVFDKLLELDDIQSIIRFKSEYKCKLVFCNWQQVAVNNGKIIIYYGVAGHGKGLVDAMISFGVK